MKIVQQRYARTTLTANQIKLLELIYKYRFSSRYLLADSLGINPQNGLHKRLEVLVKYGYVAKRFEKRLKLQAIPAAYYLTPFGIKALQALPGHEYISDKDIKASYKNKTISQDFINHTLEVYSITNSLISQYLSLKIFTRRDVSRYSYFPMPLPDAVLSLSSKDTKQPQRFFLDLIQDKLPRSAIDYRLSSYLEYFDEGGWEVTKSEPPALLLVSETGTSEKRLRRMIKSQISKNDADDLSIFTTTVSAIGNIGMEKAVWTNIEDDDELISLENII